MVVGFAGERWRVSLMADGEDELIPFFTEERAWDTIA